MQPFCQNAQLSRSLESELENAVKTGELRLSAKNLRDFPKHGDRFNLRDTILADLSRNKLVEVPGECTRYQSLERLLLYHNTIKTIPDNIVTLHSLTYLDISRNQLSYLPASICSLVNLQCLVANNNKLVSLPEEVGDMSSLMELDVSCNEIAHLPVQIGDLAALRSLHLRRNHLQEVPVELTYLQLTFLDLAGNRLSSLPVELRFMVTLCDLQLEENPLTCPPANLCGRGRVHIFKYLEIQAIKEDKKRGVLTEGEYRRSYRKTSQLNDMRFGLSADARRKRNTADSGYGSEQPLDRRWSQEFSQEAEAAPHHQTEDARRLAHRAISYRPASHAQPAIKPAMMTRPTEAMVTRPNNEAMMSRPSEAMVTRPTSHVEAMMRPSEEHAKAMMTRPTSHAEAMIRPSEDHAKAMLRPSEDHAKAMMRPPVVERADSGQGSSNSSTSPTTSLDMVTGGLGGLHIQESGKPSLDSVDGSSKAAPHHSQAPAQGPASLPYELGSSDPGAEAGAEAESEERRRAVQRVFSKQSSQSRSVGRLPLPTSSSTNTSSGTGMKSPSSPHHSGLPPPPGKEQKSISSIQTYRQFKEQQRLARQEVGPGSGSRLSQVSQYSAKTGDRTTRQSQDIKSVQKEAVLSYLDRVNSSGQVRPGAAGAPPDIAPPPPPGTASPSRHAPSHAPAPASKSTSIPTARASSVPNSRARMVSSAPSLPPAPAPATGQYQGHPSVNFTAKREAERAAAQDSHILHLRHQIETRLKVSLGEDLAAALADGVVLCHIANHVSPRAVSSIHVPSPAVPKLTGAKCRRNVDNFLSACRKIGVREDLVCSVTDIMETKRTNTVRVAITVNELLRFYSPRNNQTINI